MKIFVHRGLMDVRVDAAPVRRGSPRRLRKDQLQARRRRARLRNCRQADGGQPQGRSSSELRGPNGHHERHAPLLPAHGRSKSMAHNPRERGPRSSFPRNSQSPRGKDAELKAATDHGETGYRDGITKERGGHVLQIEGQRYEAMCYARRIGGFRQPRQKADSGLAHYSSGLFCSQALRAPRSSSRGDSIKCLRALAAHAAPFFLSSPREEHVSHGTRRTGDAKAAFT